MSHGTEFVVSPRTKTDQLLNIFAAWIQPTIAKNPKQPKPKNQTKNKTRKQHVNFSVFYSQSVNSQNCSNFLLS